MRRYAILCACSLSLLLTGCITRKLGFQPSAPPEISESHETDAVLISDWHKKYNTSLDTQKCPSGDAPVDGKCGNRTYDEAMLALRNRYIEAIKLKIDVRYDNFKASLYSGNAAAGFLSDLAVLGLSAAGGVVEDAGLKSILAVTSGGVTGGAAAYQKEILNQQNTLAIVSSMDARRAFLYSSIVANEKRTPTDYTLESAITDLRGYYIAGTLLSGLQFAQGTAQATEANATAITAACKAGKCPPVAVPPTAVPPVPVPPVGR